MAELKIKADSGGGTVSFKGPATTTSNAAVQLTLPVDDGAADQYLKTDGSGALSWATVSQTEQDASTGDYTLTSGNLVIATSGKGIDFSATGDGGSSASQVEVLDDYEEGVWTMTCDNSVTLSQDELRYTKIGNLVNISGMIIVDNDNSNAVFRPNNLPFANVGGGYKDLSTFSVHTENWNIHADHKGFGGYAENSKIYIRETRDDTGQITVTADSGANMLLNITYRTT